MKYVVIGAGGTGGAIGGFLANNGKDVTLIARGTHLSCMRQNGLCFETLDGNFTVPVHAYTMEEYEGTADVVFVCVKGYSLKDAVPFIRKISHSHTVVIPILNIYGTGRKLQEALPELLVTDGCIYIASEIKRPGTIFLSGRIFRVVYGLRRDTPQIVRESFTPLLKEIGQDLSDAQIQPVLSPHIERDALQKFSFVSPMAAIGACYNITAEAMQAEGTMRRTFANLILEIKALSDAMDISLPENIVEINLKIMDDLIPTATASMQRDLKNGRQSEIDGLVYEVIRLGSRYGVPVPVYEEIAGKLKRMVD